MPLIIPNNITPTPPARTVFLHAGVAAFGKGFSLVDEKISPLAIYEPPRIITAELVKRHGTHSLPLLGACGLLPSGGLKTSSIFDMA